MASKLLFCEAEVTAAKFYCVIKSGKGWITFFLECTFNSCLSEAKTR